MLGFWPSRDPYSYGRDYEFRSRSETTWTAETCEDYILTDSEEESEGSGKQPFRDTRQLSAENLDRKGEH